MTDPVLWQVDGIASPVAVRRSPRAKKLRLRVRPTAPHVELVLPPRLGADRARAFLDDHRGWLRRQLSRLPPALAFAEGAEIPYRGAPHRLSRITRREGPSRAENGELLIVAPEGCLPGRTRRWLIGAAKTAITEAARAKADSAGLSLHSVTLRDPKSRWGSCSAAGRLSFSWRLILAPPAVLDYVVAHEVAHLRHLDHSPAFWRLCAALAEDREAGQSWLRRHGAGLHAVGAGTVDG